MVDYQFEGGHAAHAYRDIQRGRLRKAGLLDRGWAILGAAPDPTIPSDLLRTHDRIDINDAGRIAQERGFGRAGLTVRSDIKPWKDHLQTDTSAMIMFKKRRVLFPRALLFGKPYRHIGAFWVIQSSDIRRVTDGITGFSLKNIGDVGKVSSTVSTTCYGLFVGVPQIVVMGISLTRNGYAYQSEKGKRRHIAEDEAVLRALATTGKVLTTEPEVADITGLPLWQSAGAKEETR